MKKEGHTPPERWLLGLIAFMLTVIGVSMVTLVYETTYGHLAQTAASPSDVTLVSTSSPFLQSEEAVIVPPSASSSATTTLPVKHPLFQYVEVTDGCGPHFEGECLNARSGPGTEYPVVAHLRNYMVLKVGGEVDRASTTWYKIVFDEEIRYPDRITTDWWVNADYVKVLYDEGDKTAWTNKVGTTTKRIIIDRANQTLEAYDGDTLFMKVPISTGLALTPTPAGTFSVFKKTPSRYMQGPVPGLASDQVYDLPGVPWDLYFTTDGAVIHGAYWHTSFGHPYSHGCVNLSPDDAHKLYTWTPLGTPVTVK